MKLFLHPTRNEALTSSTTAITRWSLATNPATILAQLPEVPESLYSPGYDPGGRLHTGGITRSPDGHLFAHQHLKEGGYGDPCVITWRNWADLSVVRTSALPQIQAEITSLASSPDGRWLVIGQGYPERIFLLDWQTGEVMSHHAIAGYSTTGLTFDPTSTFLAGFACHDNWGHFMLWRLDPAERALVRPQGEKWWARKEPPDQISGSMALSIVHWELDRTGIAWSERDLADSMCQTAFSPDSHLVIFNPMNSNYGDCGLELVAYEVASGQRIWCARHETENSGSFLLSPDGAFLLAPIQGHELLVYRVRDGALVQHLSTGLSEPVQALAFDHDGRTLWLATEETLVQYQPND